MPEGKRHGHAASASGWRNCTLAGRHERGRRICGTSPRGRPLRQQAWSVHRRVRERRIRPAAARRMRSHLRRGRGHEQNAHAGRHRSRTSSAVGTWLTRHRRSGTAGTTCAIPKGAHRSRRRPRHQKTGFARSGSSRFRHRTELGHGGRAPRRARYSRPRQAAVTRQMKPEPRHTLSPLPRAKVSSTPATSARRARASQIEFGRARFALTTQGWRARRSARTT